MPHDLFDFMLLFQMLAIVALWIAAMTLLILAIRWFIRDERRAKRDASSSKGKLFDE